RHGQPQGRARSRAHRAQGGRARGARPRARDPRGPRRVSRRRGRRAGPAARRALARRAAARQGGDLRDERDGVRRRAPLPARDDRAHRHDRGREGGHSRLLREAEARMDRALADELRGAIAAGREWLREALEEGIEAYERGAPISARDPEPAPAPAPSAPPPAAAADDAPASASRAAASASGPSRAPASAPAPAATALFEPVRPWGSPPTLEEVRAALGECTRCRLAQGRQRIVFGDGAPDADLLFVGEGPGEQEDLQGLPFVGRAGELLTQMIEKGLRVPRSAVYICNIVKCRPPNNRVPLADEVAA